MHLYEMPLGRTAFIDQVEWDSLSVVEAQRLREFGIEEGVTVQPLHRGGLMGGGALACRVGRMTIAMRRTHAHAILVRLGAENGDSPEADGIAAE